MVALQGPILTINKNTSILAVYKYFSLVRLPIQSWWLMVNELGLLSLMETRTRGMVWAPSSTPHYGTT